MSNAKGQTSLPSNFDFPILWVDDHPSAVDLFKKQVTEWFSTKYSGANLPIEHAADAAQALTKVNGPGYFDLLIVDNNLGSGPNGAALVKDLRNQGIYTDIIFYARLVQIPDQVVKEVSQESGFAKVVLEQELVSTIQIVIKDRLERFRKVSFLRGMVISKFIDVESALNAFLISYFKIHPDRQDHFRISILENSSISFGAKLNTLLMIAFGKQHPKKDDPISSPFGSIGYVAIVDGIQALRKVESNRNNLAHCAIRPDEKLELVTMGVTVSYDRKYLVNVLSAMSVCLNFVNTLSGCLTSEPSET